VIWLGVENASDLPLRFLPIVTDPGQIQCAVDNTV